VLCDQELTRRVFDLLIESALRDLRPDASIAISAKMDEDMEMVATIAYTQSGSDHGPPCSADARREGVAKSDSALASAAPLVESQGGEIWVAHSAPPLFAISFSLQPETTWRPHETVQDSDCR